MKSRLNLKLYQKMQLIRRTEEILIAEYHVADEMKCPIHFCVGQEAAPAALSQLILDGDTIFSHHRSHGYYLASGAPLNPMVAEFFGKANGANGGLAGSQELSSADHSFYSGTILSGAFAMAPGAALASKLRGNGNIAIGVIGDGGMEEGIVFEAMNLAAVKKLPTLFLCENNLYSIHTPMNERTLASHLIDRAESFGLPTKLLDGNDAVSLYKEFSNIINFVREENQPFFVEIETYRYCGHVGPEDDDHYNYRPDVEREEWLGRDPITALRGFLIDSGEDEVELDNIDNEIDKTVYASVAHARDSEFPSYQEAMNFNMDDSYSEIVSSLIIDTISDFDPDQQETVLRPY
ncbi:MAG: hypothetical protein CMQ40_01035 [Gammaproteobacteria bacterium]|nr:hypothetical protein [Gammaproteobacteria bacterium]